MYYNSHQWNNAASSCVLWLNTDKRRARMFKKLSLTLLTIILLVAIAGCNVINPTNPESNTSNENSPPGASDDYTEPTANQQMLPLIPGKAADVKLDANADGPTQPIRGGVGWY